MQDKVIIVGAGPGGLAAGMLLAHQGYNVKIFEKANQPGGRTSELNLDGYRFDVGPTFLMMKFVLDEIFTATGRKSSDYLDFIKLSPMYRLQFTDNYMDIFNDSEKMRSEIKRVFPGEEQGLDKFKQVEQKRYDKLMPLLLKNNNSFTGILSNKFFNAIPQFSIGQSIYQILGNYFNNPDLRIAFTFQAKYLGMSPWECPAAFGIVSYVEHSQGVYHVRGGIFEISRQMAKAIEEDGGEINYNAGVKKIIIRNKKAIGVELENNEKIMADNIIINADFGYSVNNLFEAGELKKYSSAKLDKKDISCSIFMLYLGIKKQYKLRHNTIVLAKDYKKNVEDVFSGKLTENDISFYVRDHSTTDTALAPAGKTALYVLVPVPNTRASINWDEAKAQVRQYAIDGLKNRLNLKDIEENIETERIYSPIEWQNKFNVYKGAVFNLSHKLSQMIWFRPHNKFEEIDNIYLTGGGTHPGSGLPTIWHSGRIAAGLVSGKGTY